MTKYKHKTTGDIAELNNSKAGYKLNRNTIGLIPKEYIENSNDWEKVEELEYEIIELITNIHGRKSNMQGYSKGFLEALLKDTCNVKIHSVCRISDGEI